MSWSDEELRSLHRERTARDARRSGCPDAVVLVRTAAGESSKQEHEEVVRHAADCSDCALELRTALGARDAFEAGPARRSAVSFPRAWWLAAAALVTFVLVPLLVFRPGGPPGDVTRGEIAAEVHPAPDAVLAAAPRELDWPDQLGASGYRVHVRDARAEPIWESARVGESRIDLPAEVVGRMEATEEEAAFVWTVEVEGNAARNELGPFWFRVARDPR